MDIIKLPPNVDPQTDIEEIEDKFIFVWYLLLTGSHRLSRERMYWCLDDDVKVPIVSNIISTNIFQDIKSISIWQITMISTETTTGLNWDQWWNFWTNTFRMGTYLWVNGQIFWRKSSQAIYKMKATRIRLQKLVIM